MLVKLLASHFIDDRLRLPNEVLDVSTVTPLMIGLDAEAREAIAAENIRVYGRWVGRWPNLHLLDNPPIIRTLDNAQPIAPVGSEGPR